MTSKIYFGEVMHARLQPVQHSFRYPVYFYAFVLDELEQLSRTNPLFGYNRLRPVALHDRDYLHPGPEPLRDKIQAVLTAAGLGKTLEKIILVTAARYFNYVFNPISFFYCYGQNGDLSCILAQVNNTFGEMHIYLLTDGRSGAEDGRLHFHADKAFHVSPFFPRTGRYEFRLSAVDETIDNKSTRKMAVTSGYPSAPSPARYASGHQSDRGCDPPHVGAAPAYRGVGGYG